MKSLRITDDIHEKLTGLLGELTAQSMKIQTYQDAIEALLTRSVILPPDLIAEIESFIRENKYLGYTTKEELIRDAVRRRLDVLKEKFETIDIPKIEYDRLNSAIDEMNLPYMHAADFILSQIKEIIKQYEEFEKERQKMEN